MVNYCHAVYPRDIDGTTTDPQYNTSESAVRTIGSHSTDCLSRDADAGKGSLDVHDIDGDLAT